MNKHHDTAPADMRINTRAAWRPLLKPIGRFLVAAQLALVLQPLSVLAQERPASNLSAPVAKSQADQVSDKLTQAQELVTQIKNSHVVDKTAKLQQLKLHLGAINAGVADVRAEFAATRAQLRQRNLPAEILTRHDEAVTQFEQRSSQFNQIAGKASDDEMVDALAGFFKQYPTVKRHTPIDPGKLPWGSPKATPRMPAETITAWYQKLTKDHKIQLAQAGSITTIGGVGFTHPPEPTQAPQDADLTETPDVQLTAAIRAKAQELGNNPVNISNWVRNNVQWLPTWGSIQGADSTLKTLKGNAFDTASLTIALLRASGIPARYQFGTIELPAEQVMNWVGGVQRTDAALNLLYQGGIAARGVVSGGRFTAIRMEHVWVNAYVNWSPSRGNRQGGALTTPPVLAVHGQAQHPHPNGQLNAWMPIDGSYKQYVYGQGINFAATVPFDAANALSAAQAGATITPSYVQNLNQANLQLQLTSYQDQLRSFVEAQSSSLKVGDLLGNQTIQMHTYSVLASTTPYLVVLKASERAALPDSMRWRATIQLYVSDAARAGESPSFEVQQPLSVLAGKRLTYAYEPSSASDRAVLDGAVANGQSSFAAYLVRMTAKLKLEGAELATGPATAVGQDHYLKITFTSPWEVLSRDYRVTSGDVSAIVINTTGVTATDFAARTQQYELQEIGDAATFLAESLHQIGLGWWGQKFAFERMLSAQMGVLKYNLPSHARLGQTLQVRYAFGVPRTASYRGHVMDAKLDYMAVEALSNSTARLSFIQTVGQVGSFLEGAIFDQAFLTGASRGVSSVSLLGAANQQGIPIYVISLANAGEVANLTVHPDVRQEIADAVAMGRVVTVSRDEVSHYGYRGVGYIIEDPNDGSAAYQIDGGLSGGGIDGVTSAIPFPTATFTPVIGILLGPTLKELGARLLVNDSGQMIGVGFFAEYAPPVPAPSPRPNNARVAALIATLLAILSSMNSTLEKTYPKYPTPLAVVKYSEANFAQLNFDRNEIRATAPGGTFNQNSTVVYLALSVDPVIRIALPGIVACPPTAAQSIKLAEFYQISPTLLPPYDPKRAEAYVYFEITRQGIYNEQFHSNTNGVTEVTIPENRLIPKFVYSDGLPRFYIGAWAPAIENVHLCR